MKNPMVVVRGIVLRELGHLVVASDFPANRADTRTKRVRLRNLKRSFCFLSSGGPMVKFLES